MDFRDKHLTIGRIVAELPESTEIFYNYNIDFCCGGNKLLSNVISDNNIDKEQLYEKLDQLSKDRSKAYSNHGNRFNEMPPSALSNYIQDTHHAYLRDALPKISELLTTVLRAHGRNHKELFDVYSLFGRLKGDLEQHLVKEETLLFPAFLDEDENKDEIYLLASDIIKEHEAAGQLLSELRDYTNDYKLPPDACGSYCKVYQMLEDLERDLHQHIHLENNIMLQNYDNRKCHVIEINSCEIIN